MLNNTLGTYYKLLGILLMVGYSINVSHAITIEEITQQQANTEKRLFEEAEKEQARVTTKQTTEITKKALQLEKESPCFVINQVQLEIGKNEAEAFSFLSYQLNKKSTGITNQCIGAKGLQQIINYTQTELINKGYITSKVLIKPQTLDTGILTLSIIAGKIANIYRENKDKNLNLHNAMTVDTGDILNLRELEQSVENLRMGNKTATIDIEPSLENATEPNIGLSDLIIKRQKEQKINGQLIINNFGNKSIGKLQGGMGVTINEPILSNDSLYLQYLHTLDKLNDTATKADNQNFYMSYRYPYKDWQLRFVYNHNRYTQALKGLNHDPIYKGISQRKHIEIAKTLHRTANAKIGSYIGVTHKESKTYVDDLEVLVQRRKVSDYTIGLNYERSINKHKFYLDTNLNKGVGAFNAQQEPASFYSDIDSRPLIWQINANYHTTFNIKNHNFGYNVRIDGQYSQDNLSTNNQFTIGDRYAVRGFDGKRLLSGNKGLIIGQEVSLKLPSDTPKQLYLALDKGWISTDKPEKQGYYQAVGGVLGYRFGTKHINFDAYIGKPIKSNLLSNETNVGIQMAILH